MMIYDVVIAGAGPCGLTTALALRAVDSDLSVLVLERARAMRPCGGNIGLASSSIWKVLREIGPEVEQAVQDASLKRTRMRILDGSGNQTADWEMRDAQRSVSWFDLQQALLSQLLPGTVRLGSGVASVQCEGDQVSVKTAADETVHCRMLLGCDGNRSTVREFVTPGLEPQYVGASAWRFFMEGPNPFAGEGEALVCSSGGKVLACAPVKREGRLVTYCGALATFPENRLGELNQTRYVQAVEEDAQSLDAKLQRFHSCFQSFYPPLFDFIMEHAVRESVLEHPVYAVDPEGPWSKGMVGLVGDAAHAMPPNFAQGLPSALEDAAQVAASVAQHGLCEAALRDFEKVRKQRLLPVWHASTDGAVAYYRDGDEAHNPFSSSDSRQDFLAQIEQYTAPALRPAAAA